MSDDSSLIEMIGEEFPESEVREIEVIEGKVEIIQPMNVDGMVSTYHRMTEFVKKVMRPEIDYGTIPGTAKPSLYKPGAEKLQRFFGFTAKTELAHAVEEFKVPITATEFPLFHYRYTTTIWDASGRLIATCDGEANSYESRYRWRWVPESRVPKGVDKELLEKRESMESEFAFAVDKAETTGQYGKPKEYWDSWKADIDSGVARKIQRKARTGKTFDAWERGGVEYRVPNTDIHSQVNTIIKIAQKRSYVGAVIVAANASEYFTQDIEDYVVEPVDEKVSIKNMVPDKTVMAKQLIKYTEGLGVKNAADWIKELLNTNNLDFTLDRWSEIVDLVDEMHLVE